MELKKIAAEAGTIKAQVLEDARDNENAEDQISYIRDAAERGCVGGNCNNLIYYKDTEAFYTKHADEIDEMLQDYEENTGVDLLKEADTGGNLRNFLAWFAYEVRAQEIMAELELEETEEEGGAE